MAPLLRSVAGGDTSAARACVERYTPLVSRLARRFFSSRADAEDAMQEVFLEIWRCADRYDPGEASEAAFVQTLARRRLIDRARSMRRRRVTVDIDEVSVEAPSLLPEDRLRARAVARCLESFGVAQQNAVLLFAVHGLSHREIADALELPLGTVKSHLRRSLDTLRRRFAA